MDSAAVTVATVLGNVDSIVTKAIAWVGSWMTAIVGQPILLLFMLLPLVGLGVGFIKRLVRI